MIAIDGSLGEGGGQILRSALALSLATGRSFRISKIRAGRGKPGLLRQHLTAVRAAVAVGNASIEGAELGSTALAFEPAAVRAGEHEFAVGTAGSAGLVLQAVLPALMIAGEGSQLALEGGTHNPAAPPYEFLVRGLFPVLERMGPRLGLELVRTGFFPAGGGEYRATIEPAAALQPIELPDRGKLVSQRAEILISRLPDHVAEREANTIIEQTGWPRDRIEVRRVDDSRGPGNAVVIEAEFELLTAVFTAFGARGVRAERVAGQAVRQLRRYLDSDAAVDEHLADQLLVPLAVAGGGRFTTLEPTRHFTTNVEIIRHFLDVDFRTDRLGSDLYEVIVSA